MVSRVLVAAVVALSCLIVGTEASPCKVSQSSTPISSIATSNTPAILTSSSGSLDATPTTPSETPTSLTLSTPSSSAEATPPTTPSKTPIPETPSSTPASSTTTTPTSTPTPILPPSILMNGHFDDEPPTMSPWESVAGDGVSLSFSLDDVVRQGGTRSGKIVFSGSGGLGFIRQALDMSKITPSASYQSTGWIRTSDNTECSTGYIICAWNTLAVAGSHMMPLTTAVNQFQQISTLCTWSQSQYDAGGLYIYVGFLCGSSGEGWVDTVDFVAL